jgi:hypothetical protein
MNFGNYPQLISPSERRQVMIKPRTLIDKSIVVSQELPNPLTLASDLDINQYDEPDEDLKMKKERRPKPLPPTIPAPGPFPKPPSIPNRFDSNNDLLEYEDPDDYKVAPVEYEETGLPRVPPPPVPDEMADIPRMPPPPVPLDLDIPSMPPPPVPMTTFNPPCHRPVERENTYVDESDMNPYVDPNMPREPPPPVPRKPPPIPPFPSNLASDDNVNEYAEMSGSGQNITRSASHEKRLKPVSMYEDPYADAKDLEAMRPLAMKKPSDSVEYLGPDDSNQYLGMEAYSSDSGAKWPVVSNKNASIEYLGPNDSDEYLGMENLVGNASQIQLRRSPDPSMDTSDVDCDEYLKMSDVRKSAPVTLSGGKMSLPSYSKSQSMYEIVCSPQVVDIDIDGPAVPEVWVTPVKGGKDINRNTVGNDHFKLWPHGPQSFDNEDDDAGYLLLPPKLLRSRLQSQSCEELSDRQRQTRTTDMTKPNEEGYFEINDEGIVTDDVPMPFTGLLNMKHLKKAEKSPRGSRENILNPGQLNVPTVPRFQRSVSNPDVAGKGRKASHGKRDSEESPQKRQSKLSAFIYGTLRKKKSKSRLSTDGDGSTGTSPRSKPMKATSPQDKLLKPEYRSPKEKHDKVDKHRRKLSGPPGSHKDIVGGIEITPTGKSFVKIKPKVGESSPRGTSYPDQQNLRTPSPNMGRRLPSLPSEFKEPEMLTVPRATMKHAQSQPNLL